MERSISTKIGAWFIVILALLFMLGAAVSIAHGKTTPQSNSLGAVITSSNPNVYLFGALACDHFENACMVMKDAHNRLYTNIRFNPYNTPMLNDEPVLFCGNVVDAFSDKGGPIIVTYARKASLNYQGIGCHELVSVFNVPAPKEIQ